MRRPVRADQRTGLLPEHPQREALLAAIRDYRREAVELRLAGDWPGSRRAEGAASALIDLLLGYLPAWLA